ncbi:MAG: carboxymuconolactone decarboxylase family protein [Myxococcota bacterium]
MDERTRELIAIGAAVTAHCQPCLRYHLTKAGEQGVEAGEIDEAIRIARTVRKGAQASMDQAIQSLLEGGEAGTGPASDECTQTSRFCCG